MPERATDIAAVCCHFNPCHYASRLRNYSTFRRSLAGSGVRLLTVELAFGDDPFELPADPDVIRIRGSDVMWQKERLLQIGAERLIAEGYEHLVFLDADILFDEVGWPATVRKALDAKPVAQCYGTVRIHYSDQTRVQDSAVKTYLHSGAMTGRNGYAWAFRADLFQEIGLYQHCVIGGGDGALFLGASGVATLDETWAGHPVMPESGDDDDLEARDAIRHAGPAMVSHYRNWSDRFHLLSGGKIGYADLTITALPHGALGNRKYLLRQRILDGFDPEKDIAVSPGEALRWTASGAPREPAILDYLHSRNEDERLRVA